MSAGDWKGEKPCESPQHQLAFNPLTPKSDQHLISPYNTTPASQIKVMRIKKVNATQRSEALDHQTNSPCQHRGFVYSTV